MISPQSLRCVSRSYERGYYAGYAGERFHAPLAGVWGPSDYLAGYKAGINDCLWDAYHAGRVLVEELTIEEVV